MAYHVIAKNWMIANLNKGIIGEASKKVWIENTWESGGQNWLLTRLNTEDTTDNFIAWYFHTHMRARTPFFHQKAEQSVRRRAVSITIVATAFNIHVQPGKNSQTEDKVIFSYPCLCKHVLQLLHRPHKEEGTAMLIICLGPIIFYPNWLSH